MSRPKAIVGLDLRARDRVGAVAVDRRGNLRGWAVADGEDDPASIAARALDLLSVKPEELRVLLGSELLQVGHGEGATEPDPREIEETLLAEGFDPIAATASRAVATAGDSWLVARGDEARLVPLAEDLAARAGVEPTFVADLLLLAHHLAAGDAVAETSPAGLSLVAIPDGAAPWTRSIAFGSEPDVLVSETEKTLSAAGIDGTVRLLGAARDDLGRGLEEAGWTVASTALSSTESESLPAQLELPWLLAVAEDAGEIALAGSGLVTRRESLAWARLVSFAGLAIGLLGILFMLSGLALLGLGRESETSGDAAATEIGTQLERLRQAAVLAEEVRQLRGDLAGQFLAWPPLAEVLSRLAETRPSRVGWERLAIRNGQLELDISAAGPTPLEELEQARRTIADCPGIVNLAWDAPKVAEDDLGVRQTFRAGIRPVRSMPPAQGDEKENGTQEEGP